ncbi:hypothetical protein Scep_026928 [Stephania cephalantha]|uniref:F-box protein n=1 Tax=Stephania cephalantha TaxID=152367 RepID=A0AAP0HQY5_9MAGN
MQFPSPNPQLKIRTSWQDWFKEKRNLKNVVFKMSISNPKSDDKLGAKLEEIRVDLMSLLSDEILLMVLSRVPDSQRKHNCLVCKRWLFLVGRLVRSVKVVDWGFVESGRLISRFPNLIDIDLSRACIGSSRTSGVLLTHRLVSVHLNHVDCVDFAANRFVCDEKLVPLEAVERGLSVIANGCPNLRKLVLVSASELGVSSVAEECPTLQELEIHRCDDSSLRGVSGCRNLQVLKLIGFVDGVYSSVVSDIGLTILATGCKRLVKLELSGCEGSYDGIRAIGQCCQMLEELTLSDHRMDGGWMAALSFCENLKSLKLQSCKRIDSNPGPLEHLGSCPTLERLHLERCQVRDKLSVEALFRVCVAVREVFFQDCWGLDSEMFSVASLCRRVKFLSLEGCSLLTTEGLEKVVLSWVELQRLRVVSCNNVKGSEVTPALSSLFSVLKELKWRPDTRSLLAGTDLGRKGGRFFKRGSRKGRFASV